MSGGFKFPRTNHLYNLGSATRDDLRMDLGEASALLLNSKLVVTAEEKVDGANLGIMVDGKNGKLLAQNRSSMVSGEELQFKKLGRWMESHGGRICKLLKGGRCILYGEWMALKHCIHYTRLPDYFLGFDILDLQEGKFLSRQRFREEVEQANQASLECYEPPLFTVPEVALPKALSRDSISRLCLETQSQLYDGPVEGLYLRWDEGPWLHRRAKLVRPGFQQVLDEDGHWSKMIPVKNIVDFSQQYMT